MTAVLPHYTRGPANYQAAGLIYGGQFVVPDTLTAGTTDLTVKVVAPAATAAATGNRTCLGVAGADANVITTQTGAANAYGQPLIDISVLGDYVAVYSGGWDIWCWYGGPAGPGELLVVGTGTTGHTVAGCVTGIAGTPFGNSTGDHGDHAAYGNIVARCTHPGGVSARDAHPADRRHRVRLLLPGPGPGPLGGLRHADWRERLQRFPENHCKRAAERPARHPRPDPGHHAERVRDGRGAADGRRSPVAALCVTASRHRCTPTTSPRSGLSSARSRSCPRRSACPAWCSPTSAPWRSWCRDEMRRRQAIDPVTRQLLQVKNTMVYSWNTAFYSAVVANSSHSDARGREPVGVRRGDHPVATSRRPCT